MTGLFGIWPALLASPQHSTAPVCDGKNDSWKTVRQPFQLGRASRPAISPRLASGWRVAQALLAYDSVAAARWIYAVNVLQTKVSPFGSDLRTGFLHVALLQNVWMI
jgi:hypothetical protein